MGLSYHPSSSPSILQTWGIDQNCTTYRGFQITAIISYIIDEEEDEHRMVVDSFMEWCGLNHLQLNISKIKNNLYQLQKTK